MLRPLLAGGRVARDLPPPRTVREHVLEQLASLPLDTLQRKGQRQDF
jgi:hypothetical protein